MHARIAAHNGRARSYGMSAPDSCLLRCVRCKCATRACVMRCVRARKHYRRRCLGRGGKARRRRGMIHAPCLRDQGGRPAGRPAGGWGAPRGAPGGGGGSPRPWTTRGRRGPRRRPLFDGGRMRNADCRELKKRQQQAKSQYVPGGQVTYTAASRAACLSTRKKRQPWRDPVPAFQGAQQHVASMERSLAFSFRAKRMSDQ
jgi:hypothetical protein